VEKGKKEVIKHSSAIQISNPINLLQRRAWNVLLAHAYDDLQKKDEHQIDVRDLNKYLDFSNKNNHYLKETLKALAKCFVEWNLLNKDKEIFWGITALLASVRIEKGKLFYSYSSFLKEQLFNPKMYAKISLSIQNKFKSKYSLVLYELCLDYFRVPENSGETPFILLDAFKRLMCVDEAMYKTFAQLRKRLIKEPINEINKITDLNVSVAYKRDSRKITEIKFFIKAKKQTLLLPLPINEVGGENKQGESALISRLVAIARIKTNSIRSIIAYYLAENGFDYVRSNILYANEYAKTNYALYLKRALKNDWALEKREESAFKIKESQQKNERWIVRYVEKNATEQILIGLSERLMNLDERKRVTLLKLAETRILGSKYREFLLRDENKAILEKAIQVEAINEMKS
jgi:Initiator Replication protein